MKDKPDKNKMDEIDSEVNTVTEPVSCFKGSCRYVDETLNSDCKDCEIEGLIEKDLIKSKAKTNRR